MLPEPKEVACSGEILTYEADVRAIIDQSCAYSGCHLGGAPGRYNDYAGLRAALDNGEFRERVVTRGANPTFGMPPNYAPDNRPKDLTPQQLEIITCWLEAGHPES